MSPFHVFLLGFIGQYIVPKVNGQTSSTKQSNSIENEALRRIGIYRMPPTANQPCSDFYTSVCAEVHSMPMPYSFSQGSSNQINAANLVQREVYQELIENLRHYVKSWDYRHSSIARQMFEFHKKCMESVSEDGQMAERAIKRMIAKMEKLRENEGKLNAPLLAELFPELPFLWLQKSRHMSPTKVVLRLDLGLFFDNWKLDKWEEQLGEMARKVLEALIQEMEELIKKGLIGRAEVPEWVWEMGKEVERRANALVEIEQYLKWEYDNFEVDDFSGDSVQVGNMRTEFEDGSRINWVEFFKMILPEQNYGPESEIVMYMVKLGNDGEADRECKSPIDIFAKIVAKFGKNGKLADYLDWMQIILHIWTLSNNKRFAKIFREYPLAANSMPFTKYFEFKEPGVEYERVEATVEQLQIVQQQHYCRHMTRTYFPEYMDRFFATSMNQSMVREAHELFDWLIKGFEYLLETTRWMDNDEDKQKAEEKLENMKRNSFIGQLEAVGDPMEHGEKGRAKLRSIDHRYAGYYSKLQDTPDNESSFVDQLITVNAQCQRVQLANPVRFYPLPMSDVEGYYLFAWNALMIGGGMLREPLLTSGPQRSLISNFAVMGNYLGHELGHGFDDKGFNYNAEGQYEPEWWSADTKEAFVERKQCFVDQYEEMAKKMLKFEAEGLSVDGKRTLFENIADNTGIRVAYFALLKRLEELSQDELEVEKLNTMALIRQQNGGGQNNAIIDEITMSIEQMFFTKFAHFWCGRITRTMMEKYLQTDNHAPRQLRVNVPLSNFPAFSRAFGCPAGSPMNPEKKCAIWGDNGEN